MSFNLPNKEEILELMYYCKDLSEEVFGPIQEECTDLKCSEEDCCGEINDVSLQVFMGMFMEFLSNVAKKSSMDFLRLN